MSSANVPIEKKPRRPRLHHDPHLAQPQPNERISQMHPALFAINRHRFLKNSQIHDLLFRGLPNASGQARSTAASVRAANGTCLIRLKDRELITRLPINLAAASPWAFPHPVNVLTRAGLDELRRFVDAEEIADFIPRPLAKKLPFRTLDHEVAVRDVAIQFERAAIARDCDFGYWLGDEDFEEYKAAHFSGKMIPDGFFLLSDGERYHPQFLEIDMGSQTVASGGRGGTATIKDWTTKIGRYLDYLPHFGDDPLFTGLADPLLLTVTTSPKRMQSLLDASRKSGAGAECWFTTFARFVADWPESALGRIWTTPESSRMTALCDRLCSQAPS